MRRYLSLLVALMFFVSGCASPTGSSPSQSPTAKPTSTLRSTATPVPTATPNLPASSIPGIQLPPGFQISVYARGLNTPRFITIGPNGVLLVANRGSNSVVALIPGASPIQAAKSLTLVSNLHDPTSLHMHGGYLYIGERTSIARVQLGNDLHAGPVERIITGLPASGQHTTRTVLIGPDGRLYVSIGSSCNVCVESDPHRAAVWVYNLDGSGGHRYARGLRNAVGMAVNPWTKQVWVTVNGRDYLGENSPPKRFIPSRRAPIMAGPAAKPETSSILTLDSPGPATAWSSHSSKCRRTQLPLAWHSTTPTSSPSSTRTACTSLFMAPGIAA
jgi:glucose/arabinose dehydrogenase